MALVKPLVIFQRDFDDASPQNWVVLAYSGFGLRDAANHFGLWGVEGSDKHSNHKWANHV